MERIGRPTGIEKHAMTRMPGLPRRLPILGAVMLCLAAAPVARQDAPLLEIGRTASNGAGLALGPAGYRGFARDAVYVVGVSTAADEWPYVHPGPDDSWAGRRVHTFQVLFGLAGVPTSGEAEVVLDLLDTHSGAPPLIEMAVNGVAVGS
jgi:hypothetical protein